MDTEISTSGFGVGVGGEVAVGEGVGVEVGGGVGVGHGIGSVPVMVSTRQPVPAPLQSVARRKRKTTFWPLAAGGRLIDVVIYPLEFPVHAGLPPIGLRNPVEIVPL
jgi:hypothetical protein